MRRVKELIYPEQLSCLALGCGRLLNSCIYEIETRMSNAQWLLLGYTCAYTINGCNIGLKYAGLKKMDQSCGVYYQCRSKVAKEGRWEH